MKDSEKSLCQAKHERRRKTMIMTHLFIWFQGTSSWTHLSVQQCAGKKGHQSTLSPLQGGTQSISFLG